MLRRCAGRDEERGPTSSSAGTDEASEWAPLVLHYRSGNEYRRTALTRAAHCCGRVDREAAASSRPSCPNAHNNNNNNACVQYRSVYTPLSTEVPLALANTYFLGSPVV